MVSLRGADIKRKFGAPLVRSGHQALKHRDFCDEAKAEGGEVVGPVFGGREDHEFKMGVDTEFPYNKRGGNPAFAHAPKSLINRTARTILKIVGEV